MKQNSLKWSEEYWFPETKANSFLRKVKIARLFGMDLDNIGYKHWSHIGHTKRKVYKIPVGDKQDSSYKQFIKYYLGSWMK